MTVNNKLVAVQGISRQPLQVNYVAAPDNGSSSGGSLTFKIDNVNGAFNNGLQVQLAGRTLNNLSSGAYMELWAGSSPETLAKVATITDLTRNTYNISNYIDKNAPAAYVQVKLFAANLPSALYSWTALQSFTALEPWSQQSGQTDGFQYTLKQERTNNLWVIYRAEVENLMAKYRSQAGENATYREIQAEYDANQYVTAYQEVIAALSQTLPARFVVTGFGQLGNYPIQIQTSGTQQPVSVKLKQFKENQIQFTLHSTSPTMVNVTYDGAKANSYHVVNQGGGTYELKAGPVEGQTVVGAVYSANAVSGKVTFSLLAPPVPSKTYPRHFSAGYVSYSDGTLNIESQNPQIGEYADSIPFHMANGALIRRGPIGSSSAGLMNVPPQMLEPGDKLAITLNGQGQVSKVDAYYGVADGTVVSVQQMDITNQLTDPKIVIKDAEGQLQTFVMGSQTQLLTPRATGGSILTAMVGDLGIAPGEQVRVLYSPYVFKNQDPHAMVVEYPMQTLVSQTFAGTGWTVGNYVYGYNNVQSGPLDNNYSNPMLSPVNSSSPGYITWKLTNTRPFQGIWIKYSGRAILGATVTWYESSNGTNWTQVGSIPQDANNGNFTMHRSIYLTNQVANQNTVYLKCEMTSPFQTWGSIGGVTIAEKVPFRTLQSASISPPQGVPVVGGTVNMNLRGMFNNGDTSQLQNAQVFYMFGTPGVLQENNNSVQAVGPGTTSVQAYVSLDDTVVKTNTVTATVYQSQTFVSQTFGGTGWTVGNYVYGYNNVQSAPLSPPQYTNPMLEPVNNSVPGDIVWKLTSAKPLQGMTIQYTARAILGATVTWYEGVNGANWTEVGSVPQDANSGNFTMSRSIDLTNQVTNQSTVYLKCVITSPYQTWGSIGSVAIVGYLDS